MIIVEVFDYIKVRLRIHFIRTYLNLLVLQYKRKNCILFKQNSLEN
jgi:hypothetical protein